jgi:hypothetical protein
MEIGGGASGALAWCTSPMVGVWKNIKRGWGNFPRFVRFEMGEKSKIWCWHDVWCGDQPLNQAFLVLFSIARPHVLYRVLYSVVLG